MKFKQLRFAAVICCMTLAVSRTAAAEVDGVYRVSIFSNAPGSSALMAGDIRGAIETASNASRLPRSVGALITLCAAYLSSGDTDMAGEHCGRAVQEAEHGMVDSALLSRRVIMNARAVALANYGVLRALLGDGIEAIASLEKAARYDPRNRVIHDNLSLARAESLAAGNPCQSSARAMLVGAQGCSHACEGMR